MPEPRQSNGPRWCDLSREERIDTLLEGFWEHTQATGDAKQRVRRRVVKHFRGRRLDDPNDVINVVLREDWRERHGDTAEWDRNARAAGVVITASQPAHGRRRRA